MVSLRYDRMVRERRYCVYILANKHDTVLYTGVTNDLVRRMYEHRSGTIPGFASRYRLKKLVFFEEGLDAAGAIAREKQIKAGSRAKKIQLIDAMNPGWKDLAEGW